MNCLPIEGKYANMDVHYMDLHQNFVKPSERYEYLKCSIVFCFVNLLSLLILFIYSPKTERSLINIFRFLPVNLSQYSIPFDFLSDQ